VHGDQLFFVITELLYEYCAKEMSSNNNNNKKGLPSKKTKKNKKKKQLTRSIAFSLSKAAVAAFIP
jgi:hypothetical protein